MTREELCAKKEEALAAFGKSGPFTSCEPYGNGHINDTFLAISESGRRYILQRINHMIFTRPAEIMENILSVTEHIRKKGTAEGLDTERCTLSVVKTNGGDSLYKDSIGSFWRMYDFCEHTVAKEKVSAKRNSPIAPRRLENSRVSWLTLTPPDCTKPSRISTTPPCAMKI